MSGKCVCSSVQAGVSVYACEHGDNFGDAHQEPYTLFSEAGSLTGLELAKQVRLAGQRASPGDSPASPSSALEF